MPGSTSSPSLAIVVALAIAGTLTTSKAGAHELGFRPIVENAAFPTNLAFAPDGRAFFTEKNTGRIRVISAAGDVLPRPFATLPVDSSVDEMGLLGLVLHPDFANDPWVYAYYSSPSDGRNHLVRIRADGDVGGEPENLLTLLSTENGWHNGGDLAFGDDGKLYVTVGEGHVGKRAQDPASLGGKVLRLNDDGSVPADNPFGRDSAAYVMGFRNSFGLCVGRDGTLWATDNGPGEWDELNRLEPGANYGWPDHLGPGAAGGFTAPAFAWQRIVVPTGCVVEADGSVLVGDHQGDLHRISFPDGGAPRDEVVARFDAGINDVERSPEGQLYVVTDDAILVRTAGASDRGPFTPAGIVILLGLIGLLLLARRRLDRR